MAQAIFDEYAVQYTASIEASTGRSHEFFTRAKVHHLRQLTGRYMAKPLCEADVLDVGCGPGLTDGLLSPHVGRLQGIDISAEMVIEASANNPACGYSTYDGEGLPFADSSFDLVFAINVLHHVDPHRWDALVADMWRVTSPGGVAVVIEHNPANPLTRRAVSRCAFDADAVLLGPSRVRQAFDLVGARAHRRYILFAPFGDVRTRTFEQLLGWCPAGAQHIVWATRQSSVFTVPQ